MSEFFDKVQASAGSDADNATTESSDTGNTQETTEQPEPQHVEQAEPQAEKLYAGKYKTVEELERAYQQMQGYDDKLPQQLADMRRTGSVQPQQGAQGGSQMPIADPNIVKQMAPVLAPFMAPMMQQLKQQQDHLMQLQLQSEVTRLKAENEDFEEVAPVIPKLFEATPELFNLPNPVETAYLLAKSQVAQQNIQKVYNDAQKAAYDSKSAKQQAVTERQQGKAQQTQVSPEEEIAKSILSAANQGGSIF